MKIFFRQPPFFNILLVSIIALYELIGEFAFDKVLRAYVKTELRDVKLTNGIAFDQFIGQTYDKVGIPTILQSAAAWIGTLKRLFVRILNASTIHFDTSLQYYLARIDLWNDTVTGEHFESIEIEETFLLRHTYVLLCKLESREKQANGIESEIIVQQTMINIEEQRMVARTWHITTCGTCNKRAILSKPVTQRNYVSEHQRWHKL